MFEPSLAVQLVPKIPWRRLPRLSGHRCCCDVTNPSVLQIVRCVVSMAHLALLLLAALAPGLPAQQNSDDYSQDYLQDYSSPGQDYPDVPDEFPLLAADLCRLSDGKSNIVLDLAESDGKEFSQHTQVLKMNICYMMTVSVCRSASTRYLLKGLDLLHSSAFSQAGHAFLQNTTPICHHHAPPTKTTWPS